jgi:DnaJ-domain-containing protein 1
MNTSDVAAFLERTRSAWISGKLSSLSGAFETEARNDFITGTNIGIPIFIEAIKALNPRSLEWLYCFASPRNLNWVLTSQRLMLRANSAHKHVIYELSDIRNFTVSGWWTAKVIITLRDGKRHTYKALEEFIREEVVRHAISRATVELENQRDMDGASQENSKNHKRKAFQFASAHDSDEAENYYKHVLGIRERVSPSELKSKYRDAISKYHPDRVHGLGDELRELAEKKSQEINEAYAFFCEKLGI